MSQPSLKLILEAVLLAADGPLSLDHMQTLFASEDVPDKPALRAALAELEHDYQSRGIQIVEVGSGWRIQVRETMAPWVSRLWEERPGRYSRALLETLAIIAYRQPVTRGEIEEIRGVSISTSIMRTLQERGWVRSVGHRDVPGRPAMFGTTRLFLDHFNLKSLDQLPTLAELRNLEEINQGLDFDFSNETVGDMEPDVDDV